MSLPKTIQCCFDFLTIVEYIRLSGQFQACLSFIYKKIFWAYNNANQAKTNQQNRNKQTKNNKGKKFLRIKTSKRGEIGYFALWCFLYAQNLFVKKLKLAWNCPDSLIYLTTDVYPYQATHQEFICTHVYSW